MTRAIVVGLIGLVLLALGLSLFAYFARDDDESGEVAATAPASGMQLVQSFRCHRAERKHIIVRGVEDDFSPEGDEPIAIHPRSQGNYLASMTRGASYDQSQPDRVFTDYLELPPDVASGILVVGLRAVAANENDTISIGELGGSSVVPDRARIFQTTVRQLSATPGWRNHGPLHYAELKNIRIQHQAGTVSGGLRIVTPPGPVQTLLDLIRDAAGQHLLELRVADDTSVDFVAMAICREPPSGTGMTLNVLRIVEHPRRVVTLSCSAGSAAQHVCDPYVGDTSCRAALPVACFRDRHAPIPEPVRAARLGLNWSGGEVAVAPARRADAFRSIADVDSYCATQFGRGWRTLTYHDGGRPSQITAWGTIDESHDRVWADIRGQPYATCWSH